MILKKGVYLTFIFALIITSCQKKIATKDFGKQNRNDRLYVDLDIKKFKSFTKLIERTEEIVCNDSFPKITITKNNIKKFIYLHNPCWRKFACIHIRQRNVIEINNDSVIKQNKRYDIKSLESVLKRDYFNNGINPELSDNPNKLLIKVSIDSIKMNELSKTLDLLTDTYESISNKKDIKIWLEQYYTLIPPPPPPADIDKLTIDILN